jgi:hypothetical protein
LQYGKTPASMPKGFAQARFDLDYYGLSFRQGIEFLLRHTKSDTVLVSYSSFLGRNNVHILRAEQQSRLHEVGLDSAEYFITNYRLTPYSQDQLLSKQFPYNQKLLHTISVQVNTILGVYSVNHDDPQ